MYENWIEYLTRITHGIDRKEIAAAAGIDLSGVSRWLGGQPPSAKKVIEFARGMGQRPVEALMAAGFLNAEEVVGVFEVLRPIAAITNEELLAELTVRLSHHVQQDNVGPRLVCAEDDTH